MNRHTSQTRLVGLVLATALAGTALSGCTTKGAPRADLSASKAETAMAKGQAGKAVELAETAVAGEPRNAAYRAVLGNAYLAQGRFASAIASYQDAMTLGDQSARTALSLALAHVAAGEQTRGAAVLDDWRDTIEASDLGLAYALAGQPDRGVMVLVDTLRSGENTPKVRQNLAYAYALAGQWREARLMAAQDVPADQIDQRISDWVQLSFPEATRQRVAMVLGVPATTQDPGQPRHLALANTPGASQLAAEAAATVPTQTQRAELPALDGHDSSDDREPELALARYEAPLASTPQSFEAAFAAAAPQGATPGAIMAGTMRFVSSPVIQQLSVRQGVARDRASHGLAAMGSGGTHRIQLGSFTSKQGARRAWDLYTQRHPGLCSHELELTQAKVGGRDYWRVSAAGFNAGQAQTMCKTIRQTSKDGCIAYSANNPLPGAKN